MHGSADSAEVPNRPGGVASSRYFEPGRLAGLEKMRFTARRRVEGAYSGRHSAKRLGGAGEFVDYREYAPGDDLRRVDWKAMGRMGRTYLKLYQDETDLSCTLLLDWSGSMLQGARSANNPTGSKLDWQRYFATALSHLIVLGRDAVGLAIVRDSLAEYLPPQSSMQHRSLVHQRIESTPPFGQTNLAAGLDELVLRVRRRGVLMIISDFLEPDLDKLIAGVRKFRARGWEIIALHLIHPHEEHLPEGTAFRFLGLERDGEINCRTADVRREYEQRFAAHAAAVRAGLLSVGCEYHRTLTSVSYLEVLRSFLVSRSA
ncbi:MAG: DUF58 domain-containing protein [Pirellulales bacterium]